MFKEEEKKIETPAYSKDGWQEEGEEQSKDSKFVFGKFIDDSKPIKTSGALADVADSETGLETCRGDDEDTSAFQSQSHQSLSSYVNRPQGTEQDHKREDDSQQHKRSSSNDSNASTVSFDTWAFAISDSRTVAK